MSSSRIHHEFITETYKGGMLCGPRTGNLSSSREENITGAFSLFGIVRGTREDGNAIITIIFGLVFQGSRIKDFLTGGVASID